MKISSINLNYVYGSLDRVRDEGRCVRIYSEISLRKTEPSPCLSQSHVFEVKCEVVHGEDYTNDVAKGIRRDRFIRTFLKEIAAGIDSFVTCDISIQ